MQMSEFITRTEQLVERFAKENSELAYENAVLMVALRFSVRGLILSENQIRGIVNRVWDRVLSREVATV